MVGAAMVSLFAEEARARMLATQNNATAVSPDKC
jgi:hypothetical protein